MLTFLIPFDAGAFSEVGAAKAPEIIGKCIDWEKKEIPVESSDIEETQKNIHEEAKKAQGRIFSIGGDHSVSFPLIKAFMEKYCGCVLYFDAHADCDSCFDTPSYEDVVKTLFEKGFVDNENFAFVGMTKIWENEEEFVKNRKIINFSPKDIEGIKNFIAGRKLYMSIDVDFFSKEFVPATGHPDGKASPEEFFDVLNAIREMILWWDIVEYNPLLDKDGKTKELIMKIIQQVKG